MSKTSKIRRLKRQVESLKKDLCIEEFTNKLLMQDSAVCPKQFRIEQPPELRSSNYCEEQRINRMMRYIYRQMESEIEMCYDLDPYCDHTKLEFELLKDYNDLKHDFNKLHKAVIDISLYREGTSQYQEAVDTVESFGD